jgi:hypothetical protein
LQNREAEGTVRTKHQLNLDPNPEGTQENLDDRRYGGREEQRIPHLLLTLGAARGAALGDWDFFRERKTFIPELGEGRKRQ